MMQRVDNPEQDISTTWRKFSEVWAVASRNSLYRILAISVALGARQRAKSSSQAPLYVLGWGGEGGDCYCELPRILIPRSTVHTVGSNRPTYRREEACPRETSACSQTYDAENTTTPLKRRYGKGYTT